MPNLQECKQCSCPLLFKGIGKPKKLFMVNENNSVKVLKEGYWTLNKNAYLHVVIIANTIDSVLRGIYLNFKDWRTLSIQFCNRLTATYIHNKCT